MNAIQQTGGGVTLQLKIVPNASRNRIDGLHGDAVKIRLTAPPVDGKANTALVEFLAEELQCPKSAISLVAGATARSKRILITGLAPAVIADRLGLTG